MGMMMEGRCDGADVVVKRAQQELAGYVKPWSANKALAESTTGVIEEVPVVVTEDIHE
jgi:hypothetical protein